MSKLLKGEFSWIGRISKRLQGELGNTFMWQRENVLSYAARIKEIAERIEDAHRLNNGGQVDNAFKQNLKRDVV